MLFNYFKLIFFIFLDYLYVLISKIIFKKIKIYYFNTFLNKKTILKPTGITLQYSYWKSN